MQDLGLHRKLGTEKGEQSEADHVELRRRVWGGCLIADRWISAIYGQPMMIDLAVSPQSLYILSRSYRLTGYPFRRTATAPSLPCSISAQTSSLMLRAGHTYSTGRCFPSRSCSAASSRACTRRVRLGSSGFCCLNTLTHAASIAAGIMTLSSEDALSMIKDLAA